MPTDWSTVHLLVGLPSKRGIMHECVQTLFDIRHEIEQRGGKCSFAGSRAPLLSLARGVLMLSAIEQPTMTHFLSLDDDLMINGSDVCRMIETEFPMVGAAYRIKYSDKRIQFVALFSPEQLEQEPENGTIAMQRIGGGCILYRRGALELLRQRYGTFSWGGVKGLPVATEYTDDEGTFLTEDYATCDRWRAIGGSVRLLLDCATDHISADGEHFAGNYLHIWKVRHELLGNQKLSRYNVLCGQAGPEPSNGAVHAAQETQARRAVQAAKDAVDATQTHA